MLLPLLLILGLVVILTVVGEGLLFRPSVSASRALRRRLRHPQR
jgi:hypothetical protein